MPNAMMKTRPERLSKEEVGATVSANARVSARFLFELDQSARPPSSGSNRAQTCGRRGGLRGFVIVVLEGARPGFERGRIAAAAVEVDALGELAHRCRH